MCTDLLFNTYYSFWYVHVLSITCGNFWNTFEYFWVLLSHICFEYFIVFWILLSLYIIICQVMLKHLSESMETDHFQSCLFYEFGKKNMAFLGVFWSPTPNHRWIFILFHFRRSQKHESSSPYTTCLTVCSQGLKGLKKNLETFVAKLISLLLVFKHPRKFWFGIDSASRFVQAKMKLQWYVVNPS